MINTVIPLVIGLVIGILIAYFFMQKRISSVEKKFQQTDELQKEKVIAETKLLQNVQYIEEIKLEKVKLEETISSLREKIEKQKEEGRGSRQKFWKQKKTSLSRKSCSNRQPRI